MSAVHRPLSTWVAELSPEGLLGRVNNGDDRADARLHESFSHGWSRVAIPLRDGRYALGLADGDGTTVVELDDYGRPMAMGPSALGVIVRIEEQWPAVDRGLVREITTLAEESLPLRYWLLERLGEESDDPPDEIFAILPWETLNRAADAVASAFESGGELGEMVEVRHWLTPAIRGLTGPLEQLDHGLRTGDGSIARLGVRALLTALARLDLGRVPVPSREALHNLVIALGRAEPLYRHMSRIAAARLLDDPQVTSIRSAVSSHLEAAAGSEEIREHVEVLGDTTQRVRLVETQAGRLRVTVRIPNSPETTSPLPALTDVFLPIQLSPRSEHPPQKFWIALWTDDHYRIGALDLALPIGVSDFDASFVPVGPDDLADADPAALLPSLYASTTSTADRWLDIANHLNEQHPVRIAARAFEDSL